jgi:23S rRNA (cytosine1962-C5)-methyltransferase
VTTADDPYRIVATARLRRGRDAAVRRGHPWVYRGALDGSLTVGGPVEVRADDGALLGSALVGETEGSLALRMVAYGSDVWSRESLRRRLLAAAALRRGLRLDGDAFRLVHAEGDRLPGLVVDLYADHAVVQPFTTAWHPYLAHIAEFLVADHGVATALHRLPGSPAATALTGPLPVAPLVIREGALRFPVDLVRGQKTGFFLDQRDNRRRFAELTRGSDVLNLFSYSGSFAVAALAAGARRAVNVDASAEALALARRATTLNGFAVSEADFLNGNAFEVARDLAAAGSRFDAVVVDPPAFVKRKTEAHRGLAGYREINRLALRLLAPGGLLFTCSCSALVSETQFEGSVLAAALDARRDARVLERRSAGPDHPILLVCPETRHLKALLLCVS